jgi:hypothetical protein
LSYATLFERSARLGLRDFRTAFFAGAARVVVPEIEHRLAEMVHDIAAVEIDVFDESAALFAIKNDVLMLAGRPAAFDHDADRVRRSDGGVRHIWWDEKGFTLADKMIDDPVAFADPDFDVTKKSRPS